MAVSYTHLDVYKRQDQPILPGIHHGVFILIGRLVGAEIHRMPHILRPVSYTHLRAAKAPAIIRSLVFSLLVLVLKLVSSSICFNVVRVI